MAEPNQNQGAPVACTVVARNYLPAARVLARSYLDHHPNHEFVIAVIDAAVIDPGVIDPAVIDDGRGTDTVGNGYRIVGPESLDINEEDYLRMATAYSVTELATAVKPSLLRRLRAEAPVVVYLDPDIQVFAPFPEVIELAMAHGIVLTPHFLVPLPRDGKEPDEAVIMGTGIFNLGFVAVGPGSEAFLDFWAQRLRQDAVIAPEEQLFTDQRWVDQVPALFKHVVLRDPGFNVAYWNVHERPLTTNAENGQLTAGGVPLRFYHFSGYRPERPWLLTYHCAQRPRILLSDHPHLRRLCDGYREALVAAGYAETLDAVPYLFRALPDGTTMTSLMRQLFRAGWLEAERKIEAGHRAVAIPPHAFGPDDGAEFRRWLSSPGTPAEAGAGLNRWTMGVWAGRPDLQSAFPHPTGADASAFRHWCRTSGAAEEMLADWALPREPAPVAAPEDRLGVNVLGYLTAELGLGEMGRIVHDAIQQAGIPLVSVVEDRSVANRTGLASPETVGQPVFPVSLLCVNADQTRLILESHPSVAHQRYRIGLWSWELADFPEWLHDAFGMVDEVWTVSEFCRSAIAKHSPVPVKVIPVPVRDPGKRPPSTRRPGQPVQFLFAFDFNSIGQRKNPWGLVTAFQRAFQGRDDVRLVIKAINGKLQPRDAERLRSAVTDDPRIELLEQYLSVRELDELYAQSDCYVSLHRSEGFGLTLAEAMARGLPVISTGYSATTEFLDASTGWPIPYQLIDVGPDCYPYHETAVWADPCLDDAARAMREVADNPAEAARRGRAAREDIIRTRPVRVAAEWMHDQLEAAYQSWRSRGGAPVRHWPPGPLVQSREALRWRPEVSTPSRIPLAPALRRAVLRALDHYDVHQRRVMTALVDDAEKALRRIEGRLSSVESHVTASQHAAEQVRQHLFDDLASMRSRIEENEKRTFDMFVERDRRIDSDELTLQQVKRDITAVHEAAALRHGPVPPTAEVVLCDAGALLVPRDDVVLPWLAYHRSWEVSEARLMAKLAGAGTVLDVGAHVGYHTLRLLRECPDLVRVVAVEANPEIAELLRRNVAVNLTPESAQRVVVLPVAAWDSDGTVRLVREDVNNSGDSRVRDPRTSGGDSAGTEVPAVRLGGLPEVTASKVALVKVDLQGRDHRALAGLSEVLDRDHPHVVCEFCPEDIASLGDDPSAVLSMYRSWGYRPIPVNDDGPQLGKHSDAALIAAAGAAQSGFLTLWLQPV